MIKPIGATMSWSGKVVLDFGGYILYGNADRLLYPEYFPDNCEWPIDPITKEKLSIIETN